MEENTDSFSIIEFSKCYVTGSVGIEYFMEVIFPGFEDREDSIKILI